MVKKLTISNYSKSSRWEEFVWIDDEDYEKCKNMIWRMMEQPHHQTNMKVYTIQNGKRVYLQRYILDLNKEDKNKLVVFRDTEDQSNYTRCNLLLVDKSYRSRTTQRTWGKSKHKGVSWDSGRNKWKATVRRKGKTLFTKSFEYEDEAAEAYINAVKEIDADKKM